MTIHITKSYNPLNVNGKSHSAATVAMVIGNISYRPIYVGAKRNPARSGLFIGHVAVVSITQTVCQLMECCMSLICVVGIVFYVAPFVQAVCYAASQTVNSAAVSETQS